MVLGNAAQTLHPVAGQGLNLGLRDAWELAQWSADCDRAEIGGAAQLAGLSRAGGGSTAAARSASPTRWCGCSPTSSRRCKLARGLGLAALGAVPPAKDFSCGA